LIGKAGIGLLHGVVHRMTEFTSWRLRSPAWHESWRAGAYSVRTTAPTSAGSRHRIHWCSGIAGLPASVEAS
jgi:hypothetical protein